MPDIDALQRQALAALVDLIQQGKVGAGDLLKVLALPGSDSEAPAPLQFHIKVLEEE